jgi:Arc/MetJ family transcription regulator
MCIFLIDHTHEVGMRTNIDIDDMLMKRAMEEGGLPTKKATVEEALREFIRRRELTQALKELQGIGWEGDLDGMREGRFIDEEPW